MVAAAAVLVPFRTQKDGKRLPRVWCRIPWHHHFATALRRLA